MFNQVVAVTQNKFFPEADNWMWNYCHYLGSIRDTDGRPYDLGIWISGDKTELSFALVDGNNSGSYHSGNIYMDGMIQLSAIRWLQTEDLLPHRVTFKLAQEAGFFKEMKHQIDLEIISKYSLDKYRFLFDATQDVECITVLESGEQIKTICSRSGKDPYAYPFNSETYEEIDTNLIHHFIAA